MSKLKHTPGPWEIKQDDRGYFENIGPLSMGFTHADDVWLDIEEADARLIAAAPEMLGALIMIYKVWHEDSILISSVKAIIEKATGLKIGEVLNEN